jgi:hypothetical protein
VPYVGVNSQALTYSSRDNSRAEQLRSTLIQDFPSRMNTNNIWMVSKQRSVPCGNDLPPEGGASKRRHTRRQDNRGHGRSRDVPQLPKAPTPHRSGAGEPYCHVHFTQRTRANHAQWILDPIGRA